MKPSLLIPKDWRRVYVGRTREGDRLIDLDTKETRAVSVSVGSTVADMERNRFVVIRHRFAAPKAK